MTAPKRMAQTRCSAPDPLVNGDDSRCFEHAIDLSVTTSIPGRRLGDDDCRDDDFSACCQRFAKNQAEGATFFRER